MLFSSLPAAFFKRAGSRRWNSWPSYPGQMRFSRQARQIRCRGNRNRSREPRRRSGYRSRFPVRSQLLPNVEQFSWHWGFSPSRGPATREAQAQELTETPKPSKEHKWLAKFEGKWRLSSSGVTGPGQPPIENKDTLTFKSLGGYWLIKRMESKMRGLAFPGIHIVGYDEKTKKYVGTWGTAPTDSCEVFPCRRRERQEIGSRSGWP